MFDEMDRALRAYANAIDALKTASLSALSRDELLAVTVRHEAIRRREAVVDHALVGELDRRGVYHELSEPSTAVLLGRLLRLDPGEARARVAAARELGPRVLLDGQNVPPIFAHVAAAQGAGQISPAHAAVIIKTVEALPAEVALGEEDNVEVFMTNQALDCAPCALSQVGQLLINYLDPDGKLSDDADHRRNRGVTLATRRDSSGRLDGRLTPTCLAAWQAVTDSLAAPRPGEDGTPDPRTTALRIHDAFEEAALRLLRSGTLPDCGGVPVTIIATVDARELAAGSGLARTSHDGLISISALLLLGDEADVVTIGQSETGAVLTFGRNRRLASPSQRVALIARDGGCSFPGCTIAPQWTQAHHVVAWNDGGPTDVGNLTLVCGYHHRSFRASGWDGLMIDGIPHWRPPAWTDPDRQPRRNTSHHPHMRLRAIEEFERRPTPAA